MADVIREWLQQQFKPVVQVSASPAAQLICAKNGLELVDVLRPYSQLSQLQVPFRIGETTLRVHDLGLRFHAAHSIFQPKPEVTEMWLKDLLTRAAIKQSRAEQDVVLFMRKHKGGLPDQQSLTPWYPEYRDEFLRLLRFGDHESVDHPVAALYVIPADATQPVSHFEALQSQAAAMPPAMQSAAAATGSQAGVDYMFPATDRDFARHYVLLQDGSVMGLGEAADRRAQEALATISKAFGEAHCSLLRINTGNGDPNARGAQPDFFRIHHRPGLPGGGAGEVETQLQAPAQGLGAFLSVSDLEAVSALVRKLAVQTLLPKLEERIGRLNAGITTARRGLRNRITRLWKGAADDTVVDRPYAWHSIEGQMRQLADLAFLLHHYDFAASMYRLAAQDYLSHNNVRWYAGAEEMIAICCVLDPSDTNDPHKYFMRAYEHYVRLPGKLPRMLATRSMMLCAAYHAAGGRYMLCNQVLMRAHFEEENARAALLLEQAAYALLYPRQPSLRKFAFQMVLAGLRYHSCGQKRLAMQAYRQVLGVYEGKGWNSILEHLHDILGKHCREAGDNEAALTHFMALLRCGTRPVATQQHYLEQFSEAAKRVQTMQDGSQAIAGLPLPVINLTEVISNYNDTVCFGNTEAQGQPAGVWTRLESCLSNDQSGANWLEAALSKQQKEDEEYNTCVAGETVSVTLHFRNPLQVKLHISGVRLVCEFTPDTSASSTGGSGAATASSAAVKTTTPAGSAAPVPGSSSGSLGQGGVLGPLGPIISGRGTEAASTASPGMNGGMDDAHPLAGAGPVRPRHDHLNISDATFTLHPGEAVTQRLTVTPLTSGWLRITGVQWVLNDCVEGRDTFQAMGRRKKRPTGDRPGQRKLLLPRRRLLFNVVSAMPRLEVELHGMPKDMYQGEVVACTALLRNRGSLALRNLQLVLSGPQMCCPSDNGALGQSLEAMLQDPGQSVLRSRLPNSAVDARCQLYKVWPGVQLGPGETMQWPLLLHATSSGRLAIHSVWYCEPTAQVPAMRFRMLRLSHSVSVAPLLHLSPSLSTSPLDLRLRDMRLDISAAQEGDAARVTQVAAISRHPEQPWHLCLASSWAAPTTAAAAHSALHSILSSSAPAIRPVGSQPGAAPTNIPVPLLLQPGEQSSLFLHLVPPALRGKGSKAAPISQADDEQFEAQPLGLVRLDVTQPGGLLEHVLTCSSGPASASNTGLHHTPSMASGWQAQEAAPFAAMHSGATGHAMSGAGAQGDLQAADPPVDLVLCWRLEAGARPGTQGRLGLLKLADLTTATQTLQHPLLLQLRGRPGSSSTGSSSLTSAAPASSSQPLVVYHDFRTAPMCVVPLQLVLRNCASQTADLTIEAGGGWSGPDLRGAWHMGALVPMSPPIPPPSPSPDRPRGMDASVYSPAAVGLASRVPASGAERVVTGPTQLGVVAGSGAAAGAGLVQAGLPPSSDYIWCGKTRTQVGGVAGGACTEVEMQVCVFRPGTYTVGGCQVTAAYSTGQTGLKAHATAVPQGEVPVTGHDASVVVVSADKLVLQVEAA